MTEEPCSPAVYCSPALLFKGPGHGLEKRRIVHGDIVGRTAPAIELGWTHPG